MQNTEKFQPQMYTQVDWRIEMVQVTILHLCMTLASICKHRYRVNSTAQHSRAQCTQLNSTPHTIESKRWVLGSCLPLPLPLHLHEHIEHSGNKDIVDKPFASGVSSRMVVFVIHRMCRPLYPPLGVNVVCDVNDGERVLCPTPVVQITTEQRNDTNSQIPQNECTHQQRQRVAPHGYTFVIRPLKEKNNTKQRGKEQRQQSGGSISNNNSSSGNSQQQLRQQQHNIGVYHTEEITVYEKFEELWRKAISCD